MGVSPKGSTDEPLPPTRDPSALILRIGDTLNDHAGEIDRLFRVYQGSIFIAGVLAAVITLITLATWTYLNLADRVIFGTFDTLLIGWVVYAIWAQRGFEVVGEIEWEVDRFRFITAFELLPPRGSSAAEQIWSSLKEASHIAKELRDLPADNVKFDTEVRGKSGKIYGLDVFAHDEPRGRFRRFLVKWTLWGWPTHWIYYHFFPKLHERLHEAQTTILVKRFTKQTPVARSELEQVKNAFEDISKKLKDIPEHAIVVSSSGFSPNALDYVKDEESEIRPFADEEDSTILDLVTQRADGSYEVAYYG